MSAPPANLSAGPALPGALPPGCRAVRVLPGDRGAALRLCVLVREKPDPAAGALIVLGDRPGALVFLGCVIDAAGRMVEWLEWWVQNVDRLGFSSLPPSLREACSNAALDEQWTRQAQSWRAFAPDLALETGCEGEHPLPILLDPADWQPVNPTEPLTGAAWELCRDDAALTAARLPAYSSTSHRYLWVRAAGSMQFLPVTADAPPPPGKPAGSLAAVFDPLIPFNPGGGLMMARRLLPMDGGQFADVLSGASWSGFPHGRDTLRLGGVADALRRAEEPDGGGYLLPRAERLAERFHLKISLLLGAIRAVRETVRATGGPLLDLSAAGFRVHLPETGAASLPFLWNARPILQSCGGSMAVPTSDLSGGRWLLPTGKGSDSAGYRPGVFGRWATGVGTIRLGPLRRTENKMVSFEGVLVANQNLPAAPDDLLRVRLRLGVAGLPVDFHARPNLTGTIASGEVAFCTMEQAVSDAAARALADAEGSSLPGVAFETIPALGAPCDVYALGVLAVRFLLVNEGNSLATALDELFSLARLAASPGVHDPSLSLMARLEKSLDDDPRWATSLGPQRLSRDGFSPEQAFSQIPPTLWQQTLATIVCCFPGLDPESFCDGYGDLAGLPPEATFDAPLRQWEALARHSRSLVVVDWRRNREIRSVIDQCRLL